MEASVGGATVADERRAGERNDRRRKAVGRRVKGVGVATNFQICWAKGDEETPGSMERKRGKMAEERKRERERLLR